MTGVQTCALPICFPVTIRGLSGVFSLSGWCRQIPTGRLRPRSTQDTAMYIVYFVYGTFTLYRGLFQITSTINYKSMLQSYNPKIAVTTLVWASARSLATTCAITVVFFSSAYLDVSVQRVCYLSVDISSVYRVPPFGNLRINLVFPSHDRRAGYTRNSGYTRRTRC